MFDLCKKLFLDGTTRENLERFETSLSTPQPEFPRELNVSIDATNLKHPVHLTPDVVSDIELVKTYTGNGSDTVLDKLRVYCKTKGGRLFLESILMNPTSDIMTITQRQNIIKTITSKLTAEHIDALDTLSKNEPDVHWLFQSRDENLHDLYDMVYFRFFLLRKCNTSSHALTGINLYKMFVSPAIGILSPVAYFIIPYMIMRFKFEVNIPFTTYMKFIFSSIFHGDMMSLLMGGTNGGFGSGVKWISFVFSMVFYFQGMFNSVEVSRTIYKISKFLVEKANKVVEALKAANFLVQTLWTEDISATFSIPALGHFENQEYIDTVLKTNYNPFYVYNNFGESLKFLKMINLPGIVECIRRAYVVDTTVAIGAFMKSTTNTCFVRLLNKTIPTVTFAGNWHICLDPAKAVSNSIHLEGTNMILTGPNAGGKSTFIKSIIINIILSQTIGISTSRQASITPFSVVHTQINIPDCKGKESLFEAEMYRCKNTLDILESKSGFKLIVMDEIFNSTNPVEGIAGAYAVAKKMSSFDTAMLMFTTHFLYLTKLSKATDKFVNYRMNVDTSDTIKFPYILEKGVSRQYVALELLKRTGFDETILDEAIKIKSHLMCPSRSSSDYKNKTEQ